MGTPYAKPETLLRRLAADKNVPGKIRLRAIEWLLLIEKRITATQFPKNDAVDKEAGLSGLREMLGKSPENDAQIDGD